jgi:small nuclear ribonucleoprotein B and B'
MKHFPLWIALLTSERRDNYWWFFFAVTPSPAPPAAMSMSKKSKMFQFINCRIRVRIQDNRVLVGKFLAFDRHMNLVLADTDEFRTITVKGSKEEKEEKRTLGLVLLRGETVLTISVDGALNKQAQNTDRVKQQEKGQGLPGPGQASGAARGLTGPTKGVGGPAMAAMAPMPMPPMFRGMPPPGPGMMPHPGMPPPGMAGMPPPPGGQQ